MHILTGRKSVLRMAILIADNTGGGGTIMHISHNAECVFLVCLLAHKTYQVADLSYPFSNLSHSGQK